MKEIVDKINDHINRTGKRMTTLPVDTATYLKVIHELGCDTTPEFVTICGVDVYDESTAMRLA